MVSLFRQYKGLTALVAGTFISYNVGDNAAQIADDFFEAQVLQASGVSSIAVSGTSSVIGKITVPGTSSITVSAAGAIKGKITAPGTSSITVSGAGAIKAKITAPGTSFITVSAAGTIKGKINSPGASSITVSAAGIVWAKAVPLIVSRQTDVVDKVTAIVSVFISDETVEVVDVSNNTSLIADKIILS